MIEEKTSMHGSKSTVSRHRGRWYAVGCFIVLAAGGFYTFAGDARPTEQDRMAAVRAATEAAAKAPDWPETPEELIRQFWDAAAKKDFAKCTTFCPGSVASDFLYYENFPPSPAKAIGKPQPHPKMTGVALYPVQVAFPGFPNKTVKVAIIQSPEGRWVIDGQRTLWW
jgi:hypothetical protein